MPDHDPHAPRIVIYCRISKADPAGDGLSIALQERKSRAYAEAHSLRVVEAVIDDGFSAKSLARPGLARVREMVAAGEVDGVLIYKLDRLTRSVADFGLLLAELEAANATLASVKDSLDTSSASGRLVVHIMVSVSEWERGVIGERTKEALAQARENGTYLGQPPVGYRVEGGKLVPNDRIVVVIRAHELRRQGLTLAAIGAVLEAEGVLTGGGNTSWSPRQVKRLVDAPLPAQEMAVV